MSSDAQARYDAAMRDIRKGLTFNQGGPSAEGRAATAYMELVRAGAETPIKRKYRVGRSLKKVR